MNIAIKQNNALKLTFLLLIALSLNECSKINPAPATYENIFEKVYK